MALPKLRYNDANREDILRFLQAGGDSSQVQLTDKQNELIERWRFADEKIRENRYKRNELANFITGKFGVSRDTAMRDIVNAEYVFSSSAPLNKRFLIGQRIEFLQKKINEAYIDGDRWSAGILEKQLCKYIEIYPDFLPPRSPKTIIYKFQQTNIVNSLTVEQAADQAESVLKRLEENEDY